MRKRLLPLELRLTWTACWAGWKACLEELVGQAVAVVLVVRAAREAQVVKEEKEEEKEEEKVEEKEEERVVLVEKVEDLEVVA